MDKSYLFERTFIEVVAKLLEERDIPVAEFSRDVFKVGQVKADNKWQRYTKPQKATGRPQSVPLEDAYRMAKFFGYEFAAFAWEVEREMNDKTNRRTQPKPSGVASG